MDMLSKIGKERKICALNLMIFSINKMDHKAVILWGFKEKELYIWKHFLSH